MFDKKVYKERRELLRKQVESGIILLPGNEEALRHFFDQLRILADEGIITWATQGEVYDAYVAWNR